MPTVTVTLELTAVEADDFRRLAHRLNDRGTKQCRDVVRGRLLVKLLIAAGEAEHQHRQRNREGVGKNITRPAGRKE